MASRYKIYFFHAMGRAEGARLILAQAGVKYEDRQIEPTKWPQMKPKMPFGQVPVLEVDGVLLAETRAIERFLAREHGLDGKNNLESALCDMIVDTLHDIMDGVTDIMSEMDPTQKEKLKRNFVNETLPQFADSYERMFIKNGTGCIVGNSVTWADIILAHVMSTIEGKIPNSLNNQPIIREHCQKIMNLPNIKKYVKERQNTAN